MPRITPERLDEIFAHLPFAAALRPELIEAEGGRARLRLPFTSTLVRPGGTIAGPFMMGFADFVMYVAVITVVPDGIDAVTSNLTMNFLRRPGQTPLVAEGRILRLGKRLAFGEVELFSEGDSDMVAHATCTYALPGRKE